jgi:hypothetical protein
MSFPILISVALAATPLGAAQQARLAAWFEWAAAYRDCYEPAPFSLRIDKVFTARCIEHSLRREEKAGPPQERAATQALIAATPELVGLLNARTGEAEGRKKAAGTDPAPPAFR